MKKQMKNDTGITLVALVITKIVVWSGWSSSSEVTKLRIRDIKGIKY